MQLLKTGLLAVILLASSNGVMAAAKAEAKKDTISPDEIEAKAVMNQVYESFIKLVPYIYSDKLINEGKDKKVQDEITLYLTDLQKAFKNAKHVNLLKIPGFKPSLETIDGHIQDTIDSVNSKSKVFAHARLKAMTALCVSCHSGISDKVARNAFGDAIASVKRDQFESDFQYANYLYLVRKFTEAKTHYEFAIRSATAKVDKAPKGALLDDKVVNGDIYTSLRRVLSIFTKISLRPDRAIDFLNRYKNDKNISKYTRTDIDLWIKSLEKWKNFDINSVKNINDFIAKNLAPLENSKDKVNTGDHDITLLISSGVLTKYLNDNPKSDLTPNILYWLAVAERRLSTTYFFSLSDLYLKECMIQFPKSSIAKKCYQEYEDNVIFGYSGSSGTDIPSEERRELERLKTLIK
jgi:tetratricopeptide (TPR) repeat protein